MPSVERKLAAILSADVVGYSRLMAEDEAGTIRTLRAYRTEITNLVEHHRGRVADFTGDNFLAEFPAALDAVEGAVEVQRVLKARNASLPENRRMEFRIGVHLGDVAVEGERLYGDGVNIAARLEGLAEAGGICISGTVHDLIQNKLDAGFEDLGEQSVKNIPKPVCVYRVREAARSTVTPRSGRAIGAWAVSGIALVVVGLGLWLYLRSGEEPTPTPGPPLTYIAVLPFDDMSPEGDQKWLADGMAEELIATLSRAEPLQVPARTSTFSLRGENIRKVGKELNVGSVVEGSIRRSGDQLRVTAQLIRVSDGFHLWSARYDRKLDDVFAIQSEISRAIAEAILGDLGAEYAASWLRSYEPRDVRAYELVKRGLGAMWPFLTQEGIQEAIEYYEQALAIDPDYAQAHAELGFAYFQRWDEHSRHTRSETDLAQAKAQALRALARDATNGSANNLLAGVLVRQFQWEEAREVLNRGLAHNPRHGPLRLTRAIHLMAQGRTAEALVEGRRARDLDPGESFMNYGLGVLLMYTGDYDAALDSLERAWELAPGSEAPRGALVLAYHQNGMDQEALEAAVRDLPPKLSGLEAATRQGFEKGGFLGGVRGVQDWLVASSGKPCTNSPVNSAQLLALLGEPDEMFECLDEAIDQKRLLWLKADPFVAPYRDDPRFTALLERMNLAD